MGGIWLLVGGGQERRRATTKAAIRRRRRRVFLIAVGVVVVLLLHNQVGASRSAVVCWPGIEMGLACAWRLYYIRIRCIDENSCIIRKWYSVTNCKQPEPHLLYVVCELDMCRVPECIRACFSYGRMY